MLLFGKTVTASCLKFLSNYVLVRQLKKKGKNHFKKSRILHSDSFSNTFQFPIHVKEIKTENGNQCILGIAHARKMLVKCRLVHPDTKKGLGPISKNETM